MEPSEERNKTIRARQPRPFMKIESLQKYIEQKMSMREISLKENKSLTTIRYWMKKFGLKTQWRGFFNLNDEKLLKIASESDSLNNFVQRITGKRCSGGAYYHYKKRLQKAGFDFSKFKFSGKSAGGLKTAANRNLTARSSGLRLRRSNLKKTMDLNNTPYICKQCGLSEWLGEKLLLPIDHVDGNSKNNDIKNLQYLCPNCHGVKTYNK